VAIAATPRGYLERPRPSGLADVVDVILDKGIVIDAYVRVALIGIEIITIDARGTIQQAWRGEFAPVISSADAARDRGIDQEVVGRHPLGECPCTGRLG
jgi:hypothetical protein